MWEQGKPANTRNISCITFSSTFHVISWKCGLLFYQRKSILIISDYPRKSENYKICRCSYFHKEPFQISQIWSECLSLGNPNIFYQLKIWLLSGHKRKVCLAGFFLLHSYSWMKFNEVFKKKSDSADGQSSRQSSQHTQQQHIPWSNFIHNRMVRRSNTFRISSARIPPQFLSHPICSIPKTLNSNFGSFDKLLLHFFM